MNTGLYYMYAGFILIPVFAWLMLWSARTIFRRAKEISEENRILPEGAIDTVVLDIGDVLVNFAWRDFIGRHHFSDEIFERIADATVRNDAWKEFDLGNLTYEQIIDGFVAQDQEIEKEIREVFCTPGRLKGLITKRERAIPWIREMQKAGYRVLLLSNYSEMALEDCREAMAFLDIVDGGLLSYTEHVCKPDSAYYGLLEKKYGLDPSRVIFVDDMEENVRAAKARGWHGIVYRTQEQAEEELKEAGVSYGVPR
ncbi:MAG: HAD family phosphatase [Lachnospiraceae bacterium]|nr:HAD family phosphatase [Lachnospiraceae bacterium]